ncbi:MAG: hypothetical protein O2V44_02020 [Candidatus Bathyarchaeota archaeon]|nr:hypothetical protein [Candidatus Bathyarchaeota archaeon]
MHVKTIVGITMTLLLATGLFAAFPIIGSPGWDGEIHIAVVGPRGWVQMEGLWVGTTIAADLVNLGPNGVDDGGDGDDGIVVGGSNYKIVLKDVDSHAVPTPEPTLGWADLLAALEPPFSADFVIGGFRTECVAPMVANFKTYAKNKNDTTGRAPIWFICGASTDELIDHPDTVTYPDTVRSDYLRGRYMFRNTPMNGTSLFKQLGLGILRSYVLPSRLFPMYGAPVKTYIIAEDLTWTLGMCIALAGNDFFPSPPYPVYPSPPSPFSVLGPQCDVVGVARTNPATGEGIDAAFDQIDSLNARLIIHLYSALTGVQVLTTYRDRLTNAVMVGINVESQRQEFWNTSSQKCEYEAFLNTLGTQTNVNPTASPLSTEELWWEYYDQSDDILTAFYGAPTAKSYPVYTMWGSYGVIMELDTIIEGHGAWPISTDHNVNPDLVSLIEQYDETTNGIVGKFKYTGPNPNYPYLGTGGNPTGKGTLHDLYCHPEIYTPNWPTGYVRSLITQWQLNSTGGGEAQVIWPQDQAYSRRYQIPDWVYDLETDLSFDGLVDIDDVMMPALGFGAVPGSPKWDIEADFSADGLIDIDDVIVVALDFGEFAPVWPLPM